jgi:hypothetical protein
MRHISQVIIPGATLQPGSGRSDGSTSQPRSKLPSEIGKDLATSSLKVPGELRKHSRTVAEKVSRLRKNRPWLRAILGTTGDFLLARLLGGCRPVFRASDEPQNRTQASFSDRAERQVQCLVHDRGRHGPEPSCGTRTNAWPSRTRGPATRGTTIDRSPSGLFCAHAISSPRLRFEQRMPDCTTSMLRAHGRIVEFVVAGDLLIAVQPNPVY